MKYTGIQAGLETWMEFILVAFYQDVDEAVDMLGRLFQDFENTDSVDEDRFVTVLISKPGVGKSASLSKMCKKMGYTLIDLNLACIEPTDIIGLGAREKTEDGWRTMPAPPEWAATALNGKCIIFVDEFNNTTQDVLAGFQKMFSDFVIDGHELPRTTHIVGACNPPGDDALFAQKRLSGAFRRRLCMIPIKDDFKYVMKKHDFTIPHGYMITDNNDLEKYIDYNDLSSAIVDNVYNIAGYENLNGVEKVVLIGGFGNKALNFANEMDLIDDETINVTASMNPENRYEDMDESQWKRNPVDKIDPFQQILWGTDKIRGSVSYPRSKKFLSRVENSDVYSSLYEILKERFEIDYRMDDNKLPDTRNVHEMADKAKNSSTGVDTTSGGDD